MRYAIIENDLVINIIVADEDFIATQSYDAVAVDDQVAIGSSYKDGIFTAPAPVIVQESDETSPE